jgi:hypothetical protein
LVIFDGGFIFNQGVYCKLSTLLMRQAMNTLRQFSDKERDYHAYQARQNYLRQQRTMQYELDEVRKAKEEALAEIERLKALLEEKNKSN